MLSKVFSRGPAGRKRAHAKRARSKQPGGWTESTLQWVLVVIAFVGALGRAFAPTRAKDAAWPVVDATTLAWFGLLVIAYFLPYISEIKLGDTEVKLREKADEATSGFEASILALGDLLQNWSRSAVIYYGAIAEAEETLAKTLLMNYLRDRLGEAKKWMSDDPASDVRISLWLFNEERGCLEFFFSNEISDAATIRASFAPGEGLMGQAFLERRQWNEGDAHQVPGFRIIEGGASYDAVMCMPLEVRREARPSGMLCFDKKGDAFSELAEDIGVALSVQCLLALEGYLKRRLT